MVKKLSLCEPYTGSFVDADHIVLWSGGYDSTLVLYETAMKYGTPNNKVVAISLEHYLINPDKNQTEIKKREHVIEVFQESGLHIEHRIIKVDSDMNFRFYKDSSPQAYLWLTNVLPFIKDGANLYIGYIKGDDVLPKLESVIKFKNSICEFLNKDVNVEFPLKYDTKIEVLRKVINYDIYDLCWCCETPIVKTIPCDNCPPCVTHRQALIVLAYEGYEFAKEQLQMGKTNVEKEKFNMVKVFAGFRVSVKRNCLIYTRKMILS